MIGLGRTHRIKMLKQGYLWCSGCRNFLPPDEFYESTTSANGYGNVCKKCKDKDIDKRKDKQPHKTRNQGQGKRYIVQLSGGCCQRCGYNEFPSGLSFHHINPKEKDRTVALSSATKLERIMPEIDKCILLCLNCHLSFHAGKWSAEFVKRDGLGWTIKQYTLQLKNDP